MTAQTSNPARVRFIYEIDLNTCRNDVVPVRRGRQIGFHTNVGDEAIAYDEDGCDWDVVVVALTDDFVYLRLIGRRDVR